MWDVGKKKNPEKIVFSLSSEQVQQGQWNKEKPQISCYIKWAVRLWLEVKWVFTGTELAQLPALMELTGDAGNGKEMD